MAHPPRFTLAGLLLGYLLFVASSEANQCRTGCHGIHTGKAYQEGHTYTYQLDGESVTSVTDIREEATFKLNAIVELAVKPDCVHQLRLKNVRINGAPASQAEIEAHALQFNYHNGHIDTDVCAEAGDTQASLNIKRAVISLFQDAVVQDEGSATHYETDVFGGCSTDFTFSKNGESRTINKYRNLEQCSYRENIKQDLISATFNLNSKVKSAPLLNAEQKVEQQFNRGVLSTAKSVETYKFKPFSNGDAGAQTVVETKLTFRSESAGGRSAPVSEPKSLIFEAPHQVVKSSVDAINRALLAAQESMPDAVTPFAARRFAELIKVLRRSSKNDILSVYGRVKAGAGFEKGSVKKVYLDALFRTGTGEAAEAVVELIKRREITPTEIIIYYTSLAFVRHASLSSVTAVTSLLDQRDIPRIAYLGIGSLIGKYCQEHKCEDVPEVNAALAKISSKLTKATTRQEEDVVIAALKGLGNTRYLDDVTLIKIAKIAADKSVHNRVRVAALETLPTRCSMKWKDLIFPTFADRVEDSEIRIKAYLSLVACPCSHVANTLKEVLDKETVNQVGTFITTHLRNLRASTNPDKQKAKSQLGLIKPRTKFPEDFRKFSFNNELSYIIDAFGVGTSVESNVIYSQNNFVPRSASINFTTEIFGHSFNFLELDGRVENLDRIIEEYFGPKGILQPSNLKEVVTDGRKTFDEITERIANRYKAKVGRHARHATQKQIDSFSKKVHLPETELNDDLEFDLSVKLFGAELAFLSLHSDNNKVTVDKFVDRILDAIEAGVDEAKHFEYHFKNHLQFLDAELIYPTGLGLPLILGVTGTSAVHLKTSGKIDLISIFKNPESTAIQIALEPSASIRIAGSLRVEGFGIESGLKVISTLHTATGTDVSVKLLHGNGVDINFGVPRQKQEIISVESEVLISSGAKGDDYVAPRTSKGREYSDCFDQLSSVIGLTFCGKISYPYDSLLSVQKKPLLPLSGPASLSAYIEHSDVRNYHFKAYYNTENPKARSIEIVLETPNSRTNRRISLIAEGALEPEKLVRVVFDSPFKKASLEGIIKNNAREKSLTVTVHHDSIEYFGKVGIVASGSKYRPLLEYKVPDHVEKLAGVKNGAKNPQRSGQQYTTGGVIDISDYKGGKKYIFEKVFLASSGQTLLSVDGSINGFSGGGGADLDVDYGGETISVKGNSVFSNLFNYKTEISVIPGKTKQNGFKLSAEVKGDQNTNEQSLIIIHGSDFNSETNRITYYGKHHAKYVSPQDFDVSAKRKITYPALGLVVLAEGRVNPKLVEYEVEFKYAKFNLKSELSAKTGLKKPGDFEVEFEAELLANSIEFKTARDILGDHKNKFTTSLELKPGGKYELQAIVDYDVKPENIDTQLNAELKVNGKKVLIDVGLEYNPNKVNSHINVNADGTKYIEFVLTLLRGTNPNGNLKLSLKNYLTANGHFRYQKGSAGDAQIEINIPKFNRKITGQGQVSVVGSRHLATIEILYDASKDPKKRIKLTSDSDLTPTSFDTKNTIEVLSYKTVINSKGTIQGQVNNGQINGDFDITLPNGRYVSGKINRAVTNEQGLIEGHGQLELADHETKGGKSRKLIYQGEVHKLNVDAVTFQSKHDLKLVNFNGDDVKLILALKNLPNGEDKKSVEVKFDFSGSKIPSPFTFQVALDYENEGAYGSGKVQSSLGNNLSLQANGKYVRGNNIDKPTTSETVIEIKLPSDKLKNIKLELSDSILIPVEAGGRYEYIEKNQLTYNNDKTVKFDSHFTGVGIPDKTHSVEGTGKVTVTILNNEPVTVGYNYKHNPTKELKESAAGLNVNYGNKLTSVAFDTTYHEKLDVFNLNLKAVTPIAKIRNIDIKVQHKDLDAEGKFELPKSGKTDLTLIVDQVKYTLSSQLEVTDRKFFSHIIFNSPEDKIENIVKANTLGKNEYTGEWKLSCSKGFVNVDGHVNVDSIDDFSIIVNFDSDKVKARKIHAEIANKLAKAGKRIQISISSEGKNIISGSTNYKKHSEGNKLTIEGNGSLKINENTKSSSFKFTRQLLTQDIDGEVGDDTLLNFNFGQSNVVGEFKWTNREMYILNSYCEQKSDCAQVKFQGKRAESDFKRSGEITIEVDLRKFNVPFEFGFKSTQKADLRTGFDNKATLYLHSAKEKSQYSSQIYGHPLESGIIINVPSRELALIGIVEIPKNKRFGSYKIDISSYLDRKRRPKEKTSLVITSDVAFDKDTASVSGETKFTYPSQPKEFSVKGKILIGGAHLLDANLDIDVFATRNQKIVVVANIINKPINQGYNITGTVSVTSPGQQLNVNLQEHFAISSYEVGYGLGLTYTDENRKQKSTGVFFSVDATEAYLLIYSPDMQLVEANSKIELMKNLQKVVTYVTIFGRDPVIITFEVKDLNSFKYIFQQKNNPNNKLEASGRVVVGQLAEVHADSFKDGGKKELFHILIHLDERNYLKPDFAFNKNNIVRVFESYRIRVVEIAKLVNEFIKSVTEEIVDEFTDFSMHLKKAIPDIRQILNYYVNEFTKLKNELNIETHRIKEIHDKLNEMFGEPIAAIIDALRKTGERIEELRKLFVDLVERFGEAFKAILPELQKSWRAINSALIEIVDAVLSVVSTYVKTLIDVFNSHKEEFKQIAIMASELVQDIVSIIWKTSTKIQSELTDFFTVLIAEVKALPIYEVIQQKYKQILDFNISNALLAVVDEVAYAIKQFLPTAELKELLNSIHNYIVAHIKGEKINDVQELKKLYTYTIEAIQSIIQLVQTRVNTNDFINIFETRVPIDFSGISKLPGIATLQVSVLSLFRNREWPTLVDVFHAFRPTLHPSDVIPPFGKFGSFVDGGHFFTFDGRHLTLPGKCSYVLAQDARDGNFSIAAEFNDGKLASVTITEPTESITILSTGSILVNNHAAEFPAHTKNLHAYVNTPVIRVVSDYGVKLHCNRKAPLICTVHVSGFYHGKLRGILGNGNNEPWDDFTLPSGKVTESESEFGNAFKVNSGCANVQTVDHHASHSHDSVCTEFFTGKSSLSSCFNYVPPGAYRQACDHAASAGAKKEGACLIAAAYYSACQEARIFVDIPSSCGSCQVGNKKVNIGDSFSVQHPKQQADIIFVLEQATENTKVFHELIVPLISVTKSELKDHGITDVHIGLIGFGDQLESPQHFTSKGSLNINGDVKGVKFAPRKPAISLEEFKSGDIKKRLEFLAQRLDIELGTFKLTDAYEEALAYDFRPGASKTIVGVIATPCEKSPLPISLQQLRLLLGHKAYSDLGLTYHQIATLDDILISGKAAKNVVGFDADGVFTFADSRKKTVDGSADLRSKMIVASNDVCAEFAAASGGAAFSTHNFLEAKDNLKKQFIQVVARRLTSSLISTEIKEDCVCRQHFGIHARADCKIVSRKEKEPTSRRVKVKG